MPTIQRLMNCLHPKRIFNKYLGEFVTARCGKCAVCRNTNAATWVQRLDQESQQHPFVWFVTLQYDEQHVAQYVRLRSSDTDGRLGYIDYDSKDIIWYDEISAFDEYKRSEDKEIQYCYDTKVLNVLSKRDIQLFIKKLRKYSYDKYNARLRYFLCGEYGPQTYRPHYHCLFFLDSPLLSKNFEELLADSWRFGCVFKPHIVFGSASSYVASYINCFTHLPKVYAHASIRPFKLFSKRPIIGFYNSPFIDLREILFTASDKLRLYEPTSKKFNDVPLWRSLRDRLFPRLPYYGVVSDEDRKLLYLSLFNYYLTGKTKREVKVELFNIYFFSSQLASDLDFLLYRYFVALAGGRKDLNRRNFIELPVFGRFVDVCYLVYDNAATFEVDVPFYINHIFKFYDSRQKSQLKEYFEFQEEYFKKHPISDFPLLDASFVEVVNGRPLSELTYGQRLTLISCGYSDPIVSLDFHRSADFQQMETLHNKITHDTTKTKKSNDYLLANKDKFGNIINYQNI